MLDNVEIRKIIPHRYPFLLVDKVIELEPGVRVKAIKNVTANEPFFQGHFPDYPIMPGVLIVEALAQAAGIAMAVLEENKGKLGVFAGIEEIKFKNPVFPGDTLILEAEILVSKLGVCKAKVSASKEGKLAAAGIIKFSLIKK